MINKLFFLWLWFPISIDNNRRIISIDIDYIQIDFHAIIAEIKLLLVNLDSLKNMLLLYSLTRNK